MPDNLKNKDLAAIQVDQEEILFFRDNKPKGLERLIVEALNAKGIETTIPTVRKHISSIKNSYNEAIIEEARTLIKILKGVEYEPEPSS